MTKKVARMLSTDAIDAFRKIELAKLEIENLEEELRFHLLMSKMDFKEYYRVTEEIRMEFLRKRMRR